MESDFSNNLSMIVQIAIYLAGIVFYIVVYLIYRAMKAGSDTLKAAKNDYEAKLANQQKRYNLSLKLLLEDPSNQIRLKAVIDEGAALADLDPDFTSERVINDINFARSKHLT